MVVAVDEDVNSAYRTAGIKAPALPANDPPFTVGDIKNAIPPHCFERSTLRSMGYLVTDLAIAAGFYYLSTFIDTLPVPVLAKVALWALYIFAQGCVCTGLWVIAHECGHRAFSDSTVLGDAVGLLVHSALLVPYHSWRISHRKHHRSTNDMDKDEVFVPYTRSEVGNISHEEELPGPVFVVKHVLSIAKMLLFGWPTYLLTHVTGRKYGKRTNHFEPNAPLFADSERWMIWLSDAVLVSWLGLCTYAGYTNGLAWLTKSYILPYLVVNMWLVLITDLQHTDPRIPHYRGPAWNWLKGALCTMDRDYGFLNSVFHHIGDTHVVHHLFSRMPHYHAEEAARSVIPMLGQYYLRDDVSPGLRGIVEAAWKTTINCRLVEDTGEVLWFKRK